MRTLQKILAVVGLAGVLALGVVWGSYNTTAQQSVSAIADYIQKPGHLAVLAEPILIQKPGH